MSIVHYGVKDMFFATVFPGKIHLASNPVKFWRYWNPSRRMVTFEIYHLLRKGFGVHKKTFIVFAFTFNGFVDDVVLLIGSHFVKFKVVEFGFMTIGLFFQSIIVLAWSGISRYLPHVSRFLAVPLTWLFVLLTMSIGKYVL